MHMHKNVCKQWIGVLHPSLMGCRASPTHGPLTRYVKLRVAHAPGMSGMSGSRHASRHMRDARAVMHAGIASKRFPLKSVVGKTFPVFLTHAQPAILHIW